MYLIGVALFFIGIVSSMYFKHVDVSALANPAAILLPLISVVAVLIATKGFRVFSDGFKAAVNRFYPIAEDMRGRAASLFRLLSKTVALVSVAGFLIGVIAMLSHMQDIEALGQALLAALMSPVWGIIFIAGILEPAVFILKKKPEKPKD